MERACGLVYVFNENDLINLNPYDLIELYAYMTQRQDHDIRYGMANRAVVRTMETLVNHRAKSDFEIALQLGIERLSCAPPNEDFQGLQKKRSASVLSQPKLGHVYKNEFGVKKFLRLTEAFKYSSDRLEWFQKVIRERLGRNHVLREEGSRLIHEISTVISYRTLLMRFNEIYQGSS